MTAEQEATLNRCRELLEAIGHAMFYGTGTPNADPSTATSWGTIHGFAALFEARVKAIVAEAVPTAAVTVPTQISLTGSLHS